MRRDAARLPLLPASEVRRLQRAAGNRAVLRLTRAPAPVTAADAPAGAPPRGGLPAASPAAVPAPPPGAPGAAPARAPAEAPPPVALEVVGLARPWSVALRRSANRLLDRVPRPALELRAGRLRSRQPAFRVAIWSGAAVAVAAGTAVAPAAGIAPAAFLAAAPIVALVVIAALMVHRLPSYALQFAVLAGGVPFALALGADVRAGLDVLVVALATGQVGGRIGCAMAGCCHGRPATCGLRYGAAHTPLGLPAHLVGARLVPVQLLEAAWCAALAAGNALLIASGAPAGTALATHAVGYGAGRFAFESLRGDARRPYRGGLSQAQWVSVALAVAVPAMQAAGALPFAPLPAVLSAAVLAAAARRVVRRRSGAAAWGERLREVRCWDPVARAVHDLARLPAAPAAPVSAAAGGLRLSLARDAVADEARWSYGFSRQDGPLAAADARAVAGLVLRLRHPDVTGLLLRTASRADVLIVPAPPDGSAARGTALRTEEAS